MFGKKFKKVDRHHSIIIIFQKRLYWKDPFGRSVDHDVENKPYWCVWFNFVLTVFLRHIISSHTGRNTPALRKWCAYQRPSLSLRIGLGAVPTEQLWGVGWGHHPIRGVTTSENQKYGARKLDFYTRSNFSENYLQL